MSTAPVRVLLAGWDGLAAQDHQRDMFVPAFGRHPGFEVAGVVGKAERDAQEADALGVPAFGDVAEAVTSTGAGLVSVCEQGERRHAVITEALHAGADVFVDRPVADSGTEAAELARLADEQGRHLIPAYFHRFHPRVRSAAAAIAAGRLGLPWNVQVDFFISGGRGVPEGEIANFAAFPVDIVQELIALPVRRIHAVATHAFADPDPSEPAAAEDIAVLMLDHDRGLTSTIVVGRRPHRGSGAERLIHRYRLSGSNASMLVDLAPPALAVEGRTGPLADPTGPDLLYAMLDEVFGIVALGRRSTMDAAAGVLAAQVIDAAHSSLVTGQPVDLPTNGTNA